MPAIYAEGLTKKYGDLTAVENLNLTVNEGSLFCLLGQNGSGKSTTIKMLTGQISITSGGCSLLGISPADDAVGVRAAVGIIPEQETPPGFLTSMEYLTFAGKIRGISEIKSKADWWFDFLDFGDKRNVLCKDLSRGTRQKLMFAQAFIHEPKLALIDEPLINLDPVMQRKVKGFLKDYTEKGNTIFMSTHILEAAEDICTDLAVLHRGKLLYSGAKADAVKDGMSLSDFFVELTGAGV